MIPLPYKLLGALFILLSIIAMAEYDGASRANARWQAKMLITERAAAKAYQAEVERGNALSTRLAKAEQNIQIKTVERIKYVTKVTTGKPCLDPAAVALINGVPRPNALPTESSPAGQFTPESSRALAASDSDVATWAIEVHGLYDTCAARLNTLIDYEIQSAP